MMLRVTRAQLRALQAYLRHSCVPYFDEILRVIDCLQLTDNCSVATPVNWKQGEDVVIVPSLQDPEVIKQEFPKDYKALKPYLRMTPQPNR